MKKNMPAININAATAAKILHLPANDPIIALYTGIELFEAGHRQEALVHFIIAAEHYYLPAIPYLETLTHSREKLVISEECQAKIARINVWAGWLTQCDISFKSHYQASINKLNRTQLTHQLAKKPQNKAIKRNLRDSNNELLQENTIHFFYHRAIENFANDNTDDGLTRLEQAASLGHLLAIAYFVQTNMTPTQAHPNVKTFCDIKLHQSQQTEIFAKRLLYVTERAAPDKYRLLLLNTLAQCAEPFALNMWTELLLEKNHHNTNVPPLIAIGVLQNNPTAILGLSKLVANQIPIRLPGFDASPKTTLKLLFNGIIENQQPNVPFGQSAETVQHQHHRASRYYFAMLMNQLTKDPEIYKDEALVECCEQIINSDKDLKESYVYQLCDVLTNIYLRHVFSTQDLQQQSIYRKKAIHCLKTGWELSHNKDFLRNLFYITYEDNKLLLKDSNSDPALKKQVQHELVAYIIHLDQLDEGIDLAKHLGNDYVKYIDYCAENLHRAIKTSPEPNNTLLTLYKKYVILAANAKNSEFVHILAIYHFTGEFGFPINYRKTRELIFSLPNDFQENYGLILLTTRAYLYDTPCESEKALQLLNQYANRFPRIYFDLAEYYADGYRGITPDRQKALTYYQMAIQHGVNEAYVGLGIFKLEDYDLAENLDQKAKLTDEALQFFQKAYDAKCADGAYFMGKVYLEGINNVPCDLVRAKKCFQDAISFDRQPSAQAYLTMMKAGYNGEKPIPIQYAIIKQKVLSEFEYQESSASGMLELGLLCLNFDLHAAIAYITRAAKYNNINAQYLLAILNNFITLDFFVKDPWAVQEVQANNYPELMERDLAPHVAPYISDLFRFIKLIHHYKTKKYEITVEYIETLLKTELFGSGIDFAIIEEDIKQRFAPPEIKKILLLANKFSEHEISGDRTCQQLTEKLLASSRSQQQNLQRKLSKIRDSGEVSMQNISHCLSAFLSAGGNASKAIKAAEHIHPPHGRDDRNAHQPMEGGRAKTAFAAIDDMLNSNNPTSSPKNT